MNWTSSADRLYSDLQEAAGFLRDDKKRRARARLDVLIEDVHGFIARGDVLRWPFDREAFDRAVFLFRTALIARAVLAVESDAEAALAAIEAAEVS